MIACTNLVSRQRHCFGLCHRRTAEAWAAPLIERDSNHHQEVRGHTLGHLSPSFACPRDEGPAK
eukprot:2653928-Prymnesium_polylepis.1